MSFIMLPLRMQYFGSGVIEDEEETGVSALWSGAGAESG